MTARPTARPLPLRALAVAALSLATLGVLAASCGANNVSGTTEPAPNVTDGPPLINQTAPVVPGESAVATTLASSTTVAKSAIDRTLQNGDKGDDVKMVQERLNAMKFDVGNADGIFGDNTRAAVWAYQDLIRDPQKTPKRTADGKVTPELWSQMQDGFDLTDWTPNASKRHVQISLPAQVMIVWNGPTVEVISHVSTGSGKEWCTQPKNVPPWPGATTTTNPVAGERPQKICGKSITPGGVFRVYRKNFGEWEIPLGTVFDPVFFNKGIAIHGFADVPRDPASHGCVRVPLHVGARLSKLLQKDDAIFVYDGVKDPRVYGAQAPPDDFPDPEDTPFTTTTSTTSTTTTSTTTTSTTVATTTVPTTTVAPTVPTVATTTKATTTAVTTATTAAATTATATTATTVKPTTTVATTAPPPTTTTVPTTSST
jgi:L,D-transpeptidase catalytic domain/Putative peptidoglycan binding domain